MDGWYKHSNENDIYQHNNFVLCIESYSTQPIWWHYMIITVPKVLKHPNNAFLLIGGGHNSDP
jgi:hypothetical protein